MEIGCEESDYCESAVMISLGGWWVVVGIVDSGVADFEEWSSGAFSAYICWINGGL